MKTLFIDESGDHNLSIIDPNYPLFVLAGVIIDEEYAKHELSKRMNEFKLNFFGRIDIILHTADITRNKNGFEKLIQKPYRHKFYSSLNHLINSLDFNVVACAIHKKAHLSRYGLSSLDPYFLSLNILVEQFCIDIGNGFSKGSIIAESRDPILDLELKNSWSSVQAKGTKNIRANQIKKQLGDFSLHKKSENIAGLQLADLMATPIGRYILGKTIKDDFKIIAKKFKRHKNGNIQDYGLTILPKSKKASPRYAVTDSYLKP